MATLHCTFLQPIHYITLPLLSPREIAPSPCIADERKRWCTTEEEKGIFLLINSTLHLLAHPHLYPIAIPKYLHQPPTDLPPVKPSAIALGTAFNHAVSLAVLGPVFGDAYRRAQQANTKEEYFHSKEAATAAASWGSSVVGSAIQSYGVGALINATGTLTYKGAAYLGSLIFFASAAPSIVSQVLTEKRPLDTIAIGAVARVLETVGLSLFLTYWGTRTNPFD
ncbi:DUF1761-domain-containing protein [Aaosphaeria arxii CBS 175.79]|uniref:DUF1761-domain-containing protein n=1 Tax=Aaosphaeria arxii CBS 175.79 TaxID=1450172 RepID=A0A6A5XKF3_9PLEO|nr:DUF1761-domain-containing protein [Aaosphaeria arxii CBS 175.79]KAF2013735.1 DUF1761-domain-containing protein [Aaosphaeria arxii CBS 175.79]